MLIISTSESCVFHFWQYTELDNSKKHTREISYIKYDNHSSKCITDVEINTHIKSCLLIVRPDPRCPSPPYITRLPCPLASGWASSMGTPGQNLEGWGRVRSRYLFSCFLPYEVPLNWLCLITASHCSTQGGLHYNSTTLSPLRSQQLLSSPITYCLGVVTVSHGQPQIPVCSYLLSLPL